MDRFDEIRDIILEKDRLFKENHRKYDKEYRERRKISKKFVCMIKDHPVPEINPE